MNFPFFQVDAFEEGPFTGNPAAVCVLPEALPDASMLDIARENNLSETAFLLPAGRDWDIRWFTPAAEVDLCGHATLAAGAVVLDHLDPGRDRVVFGSRSGPLGVARREGGLELDFPAWPAMPAGPDVTAGVGRALAGRPEAVLEGPYLMAVFAEEAEVAGLAPDLEAIELLPVIGVIATAPGKEADFVSRFFAPAVGVPEDPVTGSAHCMLAPHWADRLGRARLSARQISARGGTLACEVRGARVGIAGRTRLVIEGTYRL